MTAPARQAALTALRDVHTRRRPLSTAQAHLRDALPDPRDRGLAATILLGTLRWRARLDYVIARFSSRPLSRIDPDVLDLLRVSTYQLLHLERVPARAVVDDAVRLTRRLGRHGKHSAGAFVNALLRAVTEQGPRLIFPSPTPPDSPPDRDRDLRYLDTTMSHPRWLVERWYDRYGLDAATAWTRFNNMPAPITVRANRGAISSAGLALAFKQDGIETRPSRWAPDALVVTRGNPVGTPRATTRTFWVQDEASQLVAGLVAVEPGDRVLDVCASPGGKSLIIADALMGTGLLVSADRSPARVHTLSETLERFQMPDPRVLRLDGRCPPFRSIFDWVVVDAPCSGLGTLRRDPDIRWRCSPSDLTRLARLQTELLTGASQAVAPGGRLFYATCSSEPEENENVVRRFLDHEPSFDVVPPGSGRPTPPVEPEGWIRTLPHRDGLEAFFAVVLRRQMP